MPEGTHPGVITGLVDLGKQKGIVRPGLTIKDAYKLAIIVTFPDVAMEDGSPMVVTKIETASMAPKSNLKPFIESVFGKAFPTQQAADTFQFEKLLGRAALFSVVHKQSGDRVFANIKNALAIPAGMPSPKVDPSTYVLFDAVAPEPARSQALAKVPEWLQKKYAERMQDEDEAGDPNEGFGGGPVEDDDIPF